MGKLLRCRDVGMACDEEITGETVDEVLTKAAIHARRAHGVTTVTPDMHGHLLRAIQEAPGGCGTGGCGCR